MLLPFTLPPPTTQSDRGLKKLNSQKSSFVIRDVLGSYNLDLVEEGIDSEVGEPNEDGMGDSEA